VVGGAGRMQRATGPFANSPIETALTMGFGVNLYGAYFPRAREEPSDGAPAADRPAPPTHEQTDPLAPLRLLAAVDGDNGCHP